MLLLHDTSVPVHSQNERTFLTQSRSGTGNIAGVAGALAIGGPGSIFWMWISAMLGMCTKFSEVTLAVHFREIDDQGTYVGGPMYYIKNGLGKNWKWLGMLLRVPLRRQGPQAVPDRLCAGRDPRSDDGSRGHMGGRRDFQRTHGHT